MYKNVNNNTVLKSEVFGIGSETLEREFLTIYFFSSLKNVIHYKFKIL